MKKFHCCYQRDAMECGVASLAMVCRHYGRRVSLTYLESICTPTSEGVSLAGITLAAQSLGFECVSACVGIDALVIAPLPCILHWEQKHFVVLYKISSDGRMFYVADPARGCVTYTREEFTDHWCSTKANGETKGIAMFLEPTEVFYKKEIVEDKDGYSLGILSKYILNYKKYFAVIIAGLLLSCILQLIFPFLTQAIVDIGISRKSISFIWLILLGEFLIVIGKTATDFIRQWILLHISMRINISLLSDFFIKLLRLPMGFFDTKLTGDIMQRMSDHSRVQSFLTNQVLNAVFIILSAAVFATVLLIYNKWIFLAFMIGTAVYLLWVAMFLERRKQLDYELFACQAINQNYTYQFIISAQEIKLQNCETRRRHEWEDIQADLFKLQMKSLRLQQNRQAGSIFINEIKNIIITVLAASAVIEGQMTLGGMLAIQYIVGQLNSPVLQLMNLIFAFQDIRISLERINEIHERENEDKSDGLIVNLEHTGDITMDRIQFKYDPGSSQPIIDDVSLVIPKGKVTAIVGASGSGKTTLIKLMLGYYPVQNGRISIAGHEIGAYNLKCWREKCGVVMQDGVIFAESIARNIAVSDGEIDVNRLEYAARTACIHDYISRLPLGYDTKIGHDGIGLSQGQKQRILIARAVYKNPDYIFLDEATNALDAKNERTIVENLSGFYRGKTVVVVAHRLSTVRNADFIVVLERGRIVETGDHESLITQRGAYYSLVKNQLELGN